MAITLLSQGSVAALGYDSETGERGFLCKLVNRTGGASVKGTLVAASTSADSEVVLEANEYDTIGVIQEAGVVEGSAMWVWMNGSICQVLMKDSTAAVRSYVAIAADTDGRADNVAVFGAGLSAVDQHMKEIGHILQSKEAGTNVLTLCCLHFN